MALSERTRARQNRRASAAVSIARVALAVALVAPPISAFAQSAPAPSAPAPSAPPVSQQLPSREEVQPPLPDTPVPPPQVSIDARGAVEASSCPFETSSLTLQIGELRFQRPDGSPVPAEIAASLAGIAAPAGTQPLSVVCDLRDAAGNALRRDGWIASVQVPPQTIDSGALQLVVVTGRITEMRVRGEPGQYRDLLAGQIAALQALDPLNEAEAERILLTTGDVPGLDIQLSLRPAGTAPGDLIGELAIDQQRFALVGNVQNYNSARLGRETLFLRGELYGLTGLGDVTYLGVSSTADFNEQIIGQAGHVMTLDGHGTTLGGRVTYAISRPDLGLLDLKTDTLIWGLDLARPLIREVDRTLIAGIGFDYIDQETVIRGGAGNTPLNLDKIRTLYARLRGDLQDIAPERRRRWWLSATVEARKGIGIFGATPVGGTGFPAPSRPEGDAKAFVLRGSVEGELAIGPVFSFYASADGQWTDQPLLNFDEYSIGNLTVGRGYDPGANSGDRAVGFTLEPRATVPLGPVNAQLFGFYDHVELDNLDSFSTEQGRRLRSYGGGVRLTWPQRAILEIIYAHPEDRALTLDSELPPDRLLLSLTVQFRQ